VAQFEQNPEKHVISTLSEDGEILRVLEAINADVGLQLLSAPTMVSTVARSLTVKLFGMTMLLREAKVDRSFAN